jgi:CheY-like chemotaxis protein
MKHTILVVDDDATVVKGITLLLEDDFDIISFHGKSCGGPVIDWVNKNNHFDYAIIDILINGISGITIAKVIDKVYSGTKPILFLTGCDVRSIDFIEAKGLVGTHKEMDICTKPKSEEGVWFSDFILAELDKRFGLCAK